MKQASAFTDDRGAVYVEFIIALLPTLFFFLATWQLIELFAAHLVVKRAASAAARAAVVVLPDQEDQYDGQGVNDFAGLRKRDIQHAARLILQTNRHLSADFTVELSGEQSGHGELTARVGTRFRCFAGWVSLVCGGSSRELAAQSTYVYQGANYEY